MKNLNLAIAALLIAVASFTVSSCGKYDEGPKLSLRTKKMRLVGVWDTKENVDPDGTTTTDNSTTTIEFKKDGSCTLASSDPNFTYGYVGKWEFSANKEKVRATFTYGGVTTINESTILRLTNKELWLKDSDGYISKAEKK
jgi:hypothetical protein